MRFLFPDVAKREANEASLSISFSILNACKIFAISYWTKGSRSSNPAAWKRASIRAALQFYSRVSIDESLRRRERKAYHSF